MKTAPTIGCLKLAVTNVKKAARFGVKATIEEAVVDINTSARLNGSLL